jgi:hypothetical protein
MLSVLYHNGESASLGAEGFGLEACARVVPSAFTWPSVAGESSASENGKIT